jgi:hypothetical protein
VENVPDLFDKTLITVDVLNFGMQSSYFVKNSSLVSTSWTFCVPWKNSLVVDFHSTSVSAFPAGAFYRVSIDGQTAARGSELAAKLVHVPKPVGVDSPTASPTLAPTALCQGSRVLMEIKFVGVSAGDAVVLWWDLLHFFYNSSYVFSDQQVSLASSVSFCALPGTYVIDVFSKGSQDIDGKLEVYTDGEFKVSSKLPKILTFEVDGPIYAPTPAPHVATLCGDNEWLFDFNIVPDYYPHQVSAYLYKFSSTYETVFKDENMSKNRTLCLPIGQYFFYLTDNNYNGICCLYGKGHFSVNLDGREILSGSDFGSKSHVLFEVGPFSAGAVPPLPPLTCENSESAVQAYVLVSNPLVTVYSSFLAIVSGSISDLYTQEGEGWLSVCAKYPPNELILQLNTFGPSDTVYGKYILYVEGHQMKTGNLVSSSNTIAFRVPYTVSPSPTHSPSLAPSLSPVPDPLTCDLVSSCQLSVKLYGSHENLDSKVWNLVGLSSSYAESAQALNRTVCISQGNYSWLYLDNSDSYSSTSFALYLNEELLVRRTDTANSGSFSFECKPRVCKTHQCQIETTFSSLAKDSVFYWSMLDSSTADTNYFFKSTETNSSSSCVGSGVYVWAMERESGVGAADYSIIVDKSVVHEGKVSSSAASHILSCTPNPMTCPSYQCKVAVQFHPDSHADVSAWALNSFGSVKTVLSSTDNLFGGVSCVDGGQYLFVSEDAGGDGLGTGFYSISLDGDVLKNTSYSGVFDSFLFECSAVAATPSYESKCDSNHSVRADIDSHAQFFTVELYPYANEKKLETSSPSQEFCTDLSQGAELVIMGLNYGDKVNVYINGKLNTDFSASATTSELLTFYIPPSV